MILSATESSRLWTAADLEGFSDSHLPEAWCASGVSIDSRTLMPGDLFVALQGPLVDGHDHVHHARDRGASAVICHRSYPGLDIPVIKVDDSFKALHRLASMARSRAKGARIAGITGSFGKTSCREALRHILSRKGLTAATERNFNNQWGVPLSLARMHRDAEFGVFEMGMNHAGEIEPLSRLVCPHVCLITNIGSAHLGNFHSREGIARAKAEIFAGMSPGGLAILNRDDEYFDFLSGAARSKGLEIQTFGTHPDAAYRLNDLNYNANSLHISFTSPGRNIRFSMNVHGDHWALNMLGTIACAATMGVDVMESVDALSSFLPLEGRGALMKIDLKEGTLFVLDDTYNGGPQAMVAAFQALGRLQPGPGGRRIAILGDMRELGDHTVAEHRALAQPLMENAVDLVLLYGPDMRNLEAELPDSMKGGHFLHLDALCSSITSFVRGGDCILVKGGHGQRAYDGIMKKIVDLLKNMQLVNRESGFPVTANQSDSI